MILAINNQFKDDSTSLRDIGAGGRVESVGRRPQGVYIKCMIAFAFRPCRKGIDFDFHAQLLVILQPMRGEIGHGLVQFGLE